MKKLLLVIGLLLIASISQADIITFDSSSTMTRAFIINTFNASYNNQNGNIDGDNIKDGSIVSDDISKAANPLIRDNENIGEYVYSGCTIATSASLVSAIAAGTAYVEEDATGALHRVVIGTTAKTFTASKDTWVYLEYTGSIYYNEQALGATQPTTPDNAIILAKVVTDGTKVASVTDYRATTPTNLRIYTDIKNGLVISRDVSDVDVIGIGRGDIEFGSSDGKVRRNVISADINFGTTGVGALDTGSLAKGYVYLFAVADPDNSANFKGIGSAQSSAATVETNASLSTTPRLVGWAYADTTSSISADCCGAYRGRGGDAPNIVISEMNTNRTGITSSQVEIMSVPFYSSGRPVEISFTGMLEGDGSMDAIATISVDGIFFDTRMVRIDGGFNGSIPLKNIKVLKEGTHTAVVKVWCSANNLSVLGATDYPVRLVIEEK